MRLGTIKFIKAHGTLSLLLISFIILAFELIFMIVNYLSAYEALNSTLTARAKEHQQNFYFALKMTYRNMMQMSQFISNNEELNQLFLQGKKAIEREGGGSGGVEAGKARQNLLKKIKPAWDKLTKEFDVKQLQYHLGPGSLSFLRVHTPLKYGDRLDHLRYMIVDTNFDKTARSGLEIDRSGSALRSVSPVWAIDPATNKKVYVGALEAGTSVKQVMPLWASSFKVNIALLLNKSYIKKITWNKYIQQVLKNNPNIKYYVEASSSKDVNTILAAISIKNDYKTDHIELIKQQSKCFSVYYFPLRDYQGTQDKDLPPPAFVLMWEDASNLINNFHSIIITNIIYAILIFIIIEIILVWVFRRERKLATAEKNALIDGLTDIFNRRYFDHLLKGELSSAKRLNNPLSLIICDIDFFKKFNDTYGHQAGDKCLKKVAAALKKKVKRGRDCVARYGGEEFVMLLPHTDLKGALYIANLVKQGICDLNITHVNSTTEQFITLSLGVACTENLTEQDDLLGVADRYLYQAKADGRNRVVSTDTNH
ncbi:MAG: diguanylate cyclase [Victivallaceae bacterium]|nr:diguanylate cyclase [Victivallaceae bacterium]